MKKIEHIQVENIRKINNLFYKNKYISELTKNSKGRWNQ